MSDPKITRRKITDYTPDSRNANKGTERGQYLIDHSVEEVGLARSIVAANDDTIPAGNKTLQAAVDAGLEDVLEIETDGRTLVVVKRTDWPTVDSPQARKYAYLDNRASEVGLQWDAEQVLNDLKAGINLDDLFFDWELDRVLGKAQEQALDYEQAWQGMPEFEQDGISDNKLTIYFPNDDARKELALILNQIITSETNFIWFPASAKPVRQDAKSMVTQHEF